MKDFAYDNLKFEENGRKLFKPVENTVGKGEIACNKQFLLFPQCVQKACFPWASEGVVRMWVKLVLYGNGLLTHSQMTNVRVFQTERVCRRQFQT